MKYKSIVFSYVQYFGILMRTALLLSLLMQYDSNGILPASGHMIYRKGEIFKKESNIYE